jgi:hypothetical protein
VKSLSIDGMIISKWILKKHCGSTRIDSPGKEYAPVTVLLCMVLNFRVPYVPGIFRVHDKPLTFL